MIDKILLKFSDFLMFGGFIGTAVCLILENKAWKRQKIKDLQKAPTLPKETAGHEDSSLASNSVE